MGWAFWSALRQADEILRHPQAGDGLHRGSGSAPCAAIFAMECRNAARCDPVTCEMGVLSPDRSARRMGIVARVAANCVHNARRGCRDALVGDEGDRFPRVRAKRSARGLRTEIFSAAV